MKQPKRIVFPTDFSEHSKTALAYAAHLTHAFEAELHLFHAVVLHDYDTHEGRPGFPTREDLEGALSERAGQMLADLDTSDTPGISVVRAERRGTAAAPQILEYAEEIHADLIVMATHGRRGLSRLFLGSVAEEVVRHAALPVLTVRDRVRIGGGVDRGRIVAAIDFSSVSEQVMDCAEWFGVCSGAEVHLLHAVELPWQPIVYEAVPEMPSFTYEDLATEARHRLERLRDSSRLDPDRVQVHVVQGPAADGLLEWTQRTPPDLLILGRHGRSRLETFFLGSTAARAVNRAPCPVLTVNEELAAES